MRLILEVSTEEFEDLAERVEPIAVPLGLLEIRQADDSLSAQRVVRFIDSIGSANRTALGVPDDQPAVLLYLGRPHEGEVIHVGLDDRRGDAGDRAPAGDERRPVD